MNTKRCPFCFNEELVISANGLSLSCFCSNCGAFILPAFIVKNEEINLENYFRVNDKWEIYKKRYLIAGWMYEFNRGKAEPLIFNNCSDFEELLKDTRMPKTPMQRLERLLANLYKLSDRIGVGYSVDKTANKGIINGNALEFRLMDNSVRPISMAYAFSLNEAEYMFQDLQNLGYLEYKEYSGYSITPKGFERAEQLLNSNIESTSVFVAIQFSDDLLEAFREAIKPACEDCGFDALIISDKSHNNGITDEIIVEIKKSKFVIVDFTYNNNGAYWEAGYAQGLGRPIIRCCKKEWFDGKTKNVDSNGTIQEVPNNLHFDVRHYNTIIWEDYDDFAVKLKNNIRANFSDAQLRTGGQG